MITFTYICKSSIFGQKYKIFLVFVLAWYYSVSVAQVSAVSAGPSIESTILHIYKESHKDYYIWYNTLYNTTIRNTFIPKNKVLNFNWNNHCIHFCNKCGQNILYPCKQAELYIVHVLSNLTVNSILKCCG